MRNWTMNPRWFDSFHTELEWIEPTDCMYPDSPWVVTQQEADYDGEIFDIVQNRDTQEVRYTLI